MKKAQRFFIDFFFEDFFNFQQTQILSSFPHIFFKIKYSDLLIFKVDNKIIF